MYDDGPRLHGLPGDIYGRQSKGADRSIDQQLGLGRDWADREGAVINAVLSDPVSASPHSRAQRDDWPKLIKDVETGRAKWVWLWESSRGDRTAWRWLQLLETCRDRKVLIYVHADRRLYDVANVPRDWHTLADDAVENQWETEKTRMRVLRDLNDSAEAGWFHGPVPYGYARRYEMRRGRMAPVEQYEDPCEGPVITRIFDDLDAGKPGVRLANELNGEGVPTRKGGPWSTLVIRQMALNYAYIGMRSHDTENWKDGHRSMSGGQRNSATAKLYRAQWPALVDEDKFYRVRRRLLSQKSCKPGERPGAAAHLISAIARCGECQVTLSPRLYSGPKERDNRYGTRPPIYRCRNGHVTIHEDAADRYVIERILAYVARPAVLTRLRAMSPVGAEDEQAAAEAELVKAEAQLAELERKLLPDFADSFVRSATPVQTRIKDARDRITSLNAMPELGFLMDAAGSHAELAAAWDAAPLAARRAAIRRLADITVSRGGVKLPTDAERVSITWLV